MENFKNTIYFGDNLDILRNLAKEYGNNPFIDLIYIDPPFNSKRNYNLLFEDLVKSKENGQKITAMKEAFSDTWSNVSIQQELEELKRLDNRQIYFFLQGNRKIFTDSQMSYLTMMAIRIYYMRKLLKETGSFYLHCDSTMSHYLKILLDIFFGNSNFRNEIIWKRTFAHNDPNRFGKNRDSILFYSKSENYYFKPVYVKYDESYVKNFFRYEDKKGRYQLVTLTGAGKNPNDPPFHDYHPGDSGRHWSVPKRIVNSLVGEEKAKTMSILERLKLLEEAGYIVLSSKGTPRFKSYLEDLSGAPTQEVWTDIHPISSHSMERLGYPTQKPEALMERILMASSKEGDVVADFFCGCGTTVTVAEKLKRKWLGVDINHVAIGLIEEKRLVPLKSDYEVVGFPKDQKQAEFLASTNPFGFEEWVVEYVFKGHKTKKTGDGGFDGHFVFEAGGRKQTCLIEVKGGGCNVKNLREFDNVVDHQRAMIGIFVCFETQVTREMRKHCDLKGLVSLGEGMFDQVPKLSVVTLEDILNKSLPDWLKYAIKNTTYQY